MWVALLAGLSTLPHLCRVFPQPHVLQTHTKSGHPTRLIRFSRELRSRKFHRKGNNGLARWLQNSRSLEKKSHLETVVQYRELSMAMFPQFGAMPGAPPAGGSAPLLSFKAGKMEVSDKGGDKFHITPDLRKGTISLFKGPDDQLMHFSWKERPTGNVVDDVIILPEEAVYKKVDTGREGERVYLMEIAGNRRFFYWMQDKDADKDEENMKKVNELTNSPPPDDASAGRGAAGTDMMGLLSSMGGGAGGSGLGGSGGASTAGGNEQLNIQNLQSILQNMGFSPQEQAQAAGLAPPADATSSSSGSSAAAADAAAPPATATATAAATPEPAATPAAPAAPPSAATEEAAAPAATDGDSGGAGGESESGGLTAAELQRAITNISSMSISLNDVKNADKIEANGILDVSETHVVVVAVVRSGQQVYYFIMTTTRSTPLQQAISSLDQALHSDKFNIMSNFDLDPSNPRSTEAMARGGSVDAFLQVS
ncbi:unnamed protein product [Pylaiella littoralis]